MTTKRLVFSKDSKALIASLQSAEKLYLDICRDVKDLERKAEEALAFQKKTAIELSSRLNAVEFEKCLRAPFAEHMDFFGLLPDDLERLWQVHTSHSHKEFQMLYRFAVDLTLIADHCHEHSVPEKGCVLLTGNMRNVARWIRRDFIPGFHSGQILLRDVPVGSKEHEMLAYGLSDLYESFGRPVLFSMWEE